VTIGCGLPESNLPNVVNQVPQCRRDRRVCRGSLTVRQRDSGYEMCHDGDKIICVCFPALKGWANIGRRFATTSSPRLTLFAMERFARTNVFGNGRLDVNPGDRDVVRTSNPSNPPVPSVRDALHRPAVAQRQPMVAQPFKLGWVDG
jgi:hypothetical protein